MRWVLDVIWNTVRDMPASGWSAVAASFSALSATVMVMIQRRNLLESVRPEIVLVGWGRKNWKMEKVDCEIVSFSHVKNVGRGPALHVYMNGSQIEENLPQAIMSTL